MVSKLITGCLLAVLLAPICFSRQQTSIKPAYKLKDITDFGCCGVDLELTILIEALRKEPEAGAHIIGYIGPGDPPGKLLRYLRYIELNLPDFIGDSSHSVSVANGGQREKFTIEMWIVPEGASLPASHGKPSQSNSDSPSAYVFDEAGVLIMDYNKESYLSFGLACTLSYPDWGEFFRILRDKPELRGHIVIYVGHDDSVRYANKIQRFLRANLREHYAKEVKNLTMAYGGKREWSQIEIWLVPR